MRRRCSEATLQRERAGMRIVAIEHRVGRRDHRRWQPHRQPQQKGAVAGDAIDRVEAALPLEQCAAKGHRINRRHTERKLLDVQPAARRRDQQPRRRRRRLAFDHQRAPGDDLGLGAARKTCGDGFHGPLGEFVIGIEEHDPIAARPSETDIPCLVNRAVRSNDHIDRGKLPANAERFISLIRRRLRHGGSSQGESTVAIRRRARCIGPR